MSAKHTLAIDLGGTNTKMAVVTRDMKILEEMIVPTNAAQGAAHATQTWLNAIQPWLTKYKIELVGIGSPGPLDCEKGIMLESPNLKGWTNYSFTEFFTKHLGVPSYIENDANCAGLGEWAFDKDKVGDLIMLTLGTGVGSGIVSGGKLIRGVKGLGTEAGHMTIDMNGPECGCGKHGCLESFVGARRFVERYNVSAVNKVEPLDAHEVFKRAKSGDRHAEQLVHEWTRALAVGVGNLVNIFNPSKVVLTGGVSRAFNYVEPEFKKILVTQAFEASLKWTEVVVSQLQEKAGLYGAALWAQQHQ
jgi:glucokinase